MTADNDDLLNLVFGAVTLPPTSLNSPTAEKVGAIHEEIHVERRSTTHSVQSVIEHREERRESIVSEQSTVSRHSVHTTASSEATSHTSEDTLTKIDQAERDLHEYEQFVVEQSAGKHEMAESVVSHVTSRGGYEVEEAEAMHFGFGMEVHHHTSSILHEESQHEEYHFETSHQENSDDHTEHISQESVQGESIQGVPISRHSVSDNSQTGDHPVRSPVTDSLIEEFKNTSRYQQQEETRSSTSSHPEPLAFENHEQNNGYHSDSDESGVVVLKSVVKRDFDSHEVVAVENPLIKRQKSFTAPVNQQFQAELVSVVHTRVPEVDVSVSHTVAESHFEDEDIEENESVYDQTHQTAHNEEGEHSFVYQQHYDEVPHADSQHELEQEKHSGVEMRSMSSVEDVHEGQHYDEVPVGTYVFREEIGYSDGQTHVDDKHIEVIHNEAHVEELEHPEEDHRDEEHSEHHNEHEDNNSAYDESTICDDHSLHHEEFVHQPFHNRLLSESTQDDFETAQYHTHSEEQHFEHHEEEAEHQMTVPQEIGGQMLVGHHHQFTFNDAQSEVGSVALIPNVVGPKVRDEFRPVHRVEHHEIIEEELHHVVDHGAVHHDETPVYASSVTSEGFVQVSQRPKISPAAYLPAGDHFVLEEGVNTLRRRFEHGHFRSSEDDEQVTHEDIHHAIGHIDQAVASRTHSEKSRSSTVTSVQTQSSVKTSATSKSSSTVKSHRSEASLKSGVSHKSSASKASSVSTVKSSPKSEAGSVVSQKCSVSTKSVPSVAASIAKSEASTLTQGSQRSAGSVASVRSNKSTRSTKSQKSMAKSRSSTLHKIDEHNETSVIQKPTSLPLHVEVGPPTGPVLSHTPVTSPTYSDKFQSVRVVKSVRQFVQTWGAQDFIPPRSPVIFAPKTPVSPVKDTTTHEHETIPIIPEPPVRTTAPRRDSVQSIISEAPSDATSVSVHSSVSQRSARSGVSEKSNRSRKSGASHSTKSVKSHAASTHSYKNPSKRSSVDSTATLTHEDNHTEEALPALLSPAFEEHVVTEMKVRAETVVLTELVPVSERRTLFEHETNGVKRNFSINRRNTQQPLPPMVNLFD